MKSLFFVPTACVLARLAPLLLVAGCLTSPKSPTALTDEQPFDQAVAEATDGLIAQTQTLPAFLAKVEAKLAKRGVVVDPMLDAGSGQQTGATLLLEQRVTERLTQKHQAIETLPFEASNLAKAQYLLTGTMTRKPGQRGRNVFRIDLSLTELKTGQVMAQASAVARDEGLDTSPTAYYRDSPVLVKDRVIEGYVRTAATAPGERADAYYLERIATATLVNEATTLYNAER